MMARRGADEAAGGDWLEELPKAVASYNKLDHSALHQNAPGEVEGDANLRFQLRHKNAGKMLDNVAQPQERKRKLEATGAFRTLLQLTAFKRRAGVPNWSKEVHTAANVTSAQVTDQDCNKHDTGAVLPVSTRSSTVATVPQGSAPRDTQRRDATRRFLPQLVDLAMRAKAAGLTLSTAGRMMAGRADFSRVLKEQRMTFKQFVDVHGSNFRVQHRANASKIFALSAAAARIRQRADGTLMHFERLRPIRE